MTHHSTRQFSATCVKIQWKWAPFPLEGEEGLNTLQQKLDSLKCNFHWIWQFTWSANPSPGTWNVAQFVFLCTTTQIAIFGPRTWNVGADSMIVEIAEPLPKLWKLPQHMQCGEICANLQIAVFGHGTWNVEFSRSWKLPRNVECGTIQVFVHKNANCSFQPQNVEF